MISRFSDLCTAAGNVRSWRDLLGRDIDLQAIDAPVVFMHGDDDQIVPIADSALIAAKLVKKGTLKVYEKLPHGMCTTHADRLNADLLDFIKA